MTIKHAPRVLSAHGDTTAAAPPAPRPSTGLSPAEIRQIVLDILG
ncbi:hypothetical protein [Sabulicella glaciei]|uniref:Uncharacterized protein n=1 Tax=Sabulicella glaciei TaxID=2984948 RepID=A0ABT3NPT0_9PROT|nr:hypothetical protein [Roseococcus sp. MDT2-1-1]MCW8084171.1 hypothetical protein [Roseococcus sp. MDT2-1-1]